MKSGKESLVECVTSAGEMLDGLLVRLGRFDAAFEVTTPFPCLRASETLSKLKIKGGRRVLYEGKATVRNLVDTDEGLLCEVALDGAGVNLQLLPGTDEASFQSFQREWLSINKLSSEFKLAVADMALYCDNLRQWMSQVELGLKDGPPAEAEARGREFLEKLGPRVVTAINAQHERFESLAAKIPEELRGLHQAYVWREWSSHYLCAPFGHRTYYKPLGYAGDYEMMNMIHRRTFEGGSLYAKAVHFWLVNQWPAESVRNRISHLQQHLTDESARVAREGRRVRVLNLGCGPAWEVQRFIEHSPLSSEMDVTLMDFNQETLEYTRQVLQELKRRHGRRTGLHFEQSTVQQMLRSALQGRKKVEGEKFDFIYCAGLFDYLSNATCRAIVNLFFEWLQPGGLVLVANMNDSRPFRHMVEFLLDWHLIYRDSRFMATLIPQKPGAAGQVITEPTTVNLFTHVRREGAA